MPKSLSMISPGFQLCYDKKRLCFTRVLSRFGRFGAQQGRNMPPNMAPDGPNKPQLAPRWPCMAPTWPPRQPQHGHKPQQRPSWHGSWLWQKIPYFTVLFGRFGHHPALWVQALRFPHASNIAKQGSNLAQTLPPPTWPNLAQPGPPWPNIAPTCQHAPKMSLSGVNPKVWRCLAIAGLCKSLQHCRSAAASAADLPQNPSPWWCFHVFRASKARVTWI